MSIKSVYCDCYLSFNSHISYYSPKTCSSQTKNACQWINSSNVATFLNGINWSKWFYSRFFPALEYDAIDEALYFFKANIFFKNYEIKVSVRIWMLDMYDAHSVGIHNYHYTFAVGQLVDFKLNSSVLNMRYVLYKCAAWQLVIIPSWHACIFIYYDCLYFIVYRMKLTEHLYT